MFSAFPRLRVARRVTKRGLCALFLLLLASCASGTPVVHSPTPTVKLSPTAGPAPVTIPLAAPPQNCPRKPPPEVKHLDYLGLNHNVDLIGGGPFWLYGGYQGFYTVPDAVRTEWPLVKIVVEVGPNYTQPVTLRFRSQETGALVWWTDAQTPPEATTQTLVLDPQTDLEDVGHVPGLPYIPHGTASDGWKEWGIFPLFPVAGCYTLEVSWSGGSWQSVFAIGADASAFTFAGRLPA